MRYILIESTLRMVFELNVLCENWNDGMLEYWENGFWDTA